MKLLKLALLSGFVTLAAVINTFAQQPLSWYGLIPGTYSQRTSNTTTSTSRHDAPSPPVWTNTYYSMAGFNTSFYLGDTAKKAYKEFYLADANDPRYGQMNFRLLLPPGYNASDAYKYPIIVMCHGAGERGNCWVNACYVTYTSGNISSYDVRYLNNDHNLLHGGQPHLKAVYDANGKKAEDPTLNSRAFPGFVLFPQMQNGWNDTEYEKLEFIIGKLLINYKIDPNRIYIHGLSIGGAATWDMLKRKPSLYAAALPMSATSSHASFTPDVTAKLAEIPYWAFQGGIDTAPAPYDTYQIIEKMRLGGAVLRYTVYPNLGHGVWNNAYAEPDFFSWILSKNKSDVHVYYGDSTTCPTNGAGVKLGISDGFLAYQWQKDGVVIPGATTSKLVATQPGIYKGRFSRISATPIEAEWNQWSKAVKIRESNVVIPVITASSSSHFPDNLDGLSSVQLNGPSQASVLKNWYKDGVLLSDTSKSIMKTAADAGKYTLITKSLDGCPSLESNSIYITSSSPLTLNLPSNLTAQVTSSNSIQIFWTDNSINESGFELYRSTNPTNGYSFVALLPEDAISYNNNTGLQPSTTYYYKLRAVSATAKSTYTPALSVTTGIDTTPPTAPQNFVSTAIDLTSAKLAWSASTDNSGIKQYLIFSGTTQIAATGSPSTSYTITGLLSNTNYTLSVKAVDLSDNISQPSSQLNIATSFNGLDYEYSEGGKQTLAEFDWNKAEFKGHVSNFTLSPKTQVDYFYFKFHGYIQITTAGNYQFRLSSDDGSAFYLGTVNQAYSEGASGVFNASNLSQNRIAVRDGLNGCGNTPANTSANQNLSANSFYPLAVLYFEYTGGECLTVEYTGPDTNNLWVTIPNAKLTSGSAPALPAAPGVPTGLLATSPAPTMTTLSLAWGAVTATPTPQYQVYRSTDNGSTFSIVATTSTTSYTDTNLLPSKLYYYKLKTINTNGTSAFSSTVSNTTLPDSAVPSVPANLVVASKTYTNVALQWDASTDNVGVTGYKIFNGNTLVGTTPYTTFTVSNLAPATLYNFTVSAFDATPNESAKSTATPVTTNPPQTYYTLAGTGSITSLATWNTSQDGTGSAPTSFASNGQYFKITRAATLSTAWDIGGGASKVLVDNNVNLTIAAGGQINGKVIVGDNVTLNVSSPIAPNFETIAPTSTVAFNNYDATNSVPSARYGNLILNGSGLKKVTGSTLEVLGNLTLANGVGLTGLASNGTTVVVTGNVVTGAVVPPASPDGMVSLQFTDNITHNISTASSHSYYKLTVNAGATVVFDDASSSTPITLNLGSLNNGGGLDLATGSILDVKNNVLALSGDATINNANTTGKISIDHGDIQLATTSSLNSNLYFVSSANNVETLTLNLTGTGRTYVREALNVYNALTINSGVLEALGNVRIKSSATASASIRELKNGSSIVGAVTVERYIAPKLGYRYLSSAVASIKVADWQTVIAISGNFTGSNPGGTPSLYWYNEPTGGYEPFPASGGTNQALFVKGRGYASNILDSNARTLVTTGVPYQGNVDFTLTAGTGSSANGWNLLGNPYASDVVWNTTGWNATNVGNVVYVRQNNANGTFQWRTWDRSTATGTLENGKIPAGQAFWVQTSTAPVLTVKENAKTTEAAAANTEYYRESTKPLTNFLAMELSNSTNKDFAYIKFTEDGVDGYNKLVDGIKMPNTSVNLSTLSSDGKSLTVNDLSNAFCEKSVEISLANVAQGSYTLGFTTIRNFALAQVQLVDAYLSKTIDLNDANAEYQVTVNADVASYKNRLTLKFVRPDVNTDYALSTVKPVVCGANEVATLTVANSQVGVQYEALTASGEVSEKVIGTGEALQFNIAASKLTDGENTLQVRASFPGGCTPALLTATALITKSQLPRVVIDSPYVYACIGSEKQLTVGGTGVSYRWYDATLGKVLPVTTNSLTITEVTSNRNDYYVSATNEKGCTSETKILSVLADLPTTPILTFENGTFLATVDAENIQWLLNGEPIAGATNARTYTPTLPGKYSVRNVGEYCSKESEPFDYLVTGLNTGEGHFTMQAYPNPSETGSVSIIGTSNNQQGIECHVVDMLGKIILTKTISYQEYIKGVHLTDRLPGGLYIITTNQKNVTLQQKLLVH